MEARYELINYIIDKFNFNKYLEIGYQDGICFDNIKIKEKYSVDPLPRRYEERLFKMTSDEFFNSYDTKYDIIFIDGLHTYEQVKNDFENSLLRLNDGGIIVFHDMNPMDIEYNGYIITGEERSLSFNEGGQWNGDCYKVAIDIYNGVYDNYYITVDIDQGCMVLFKDRKRPTKKNNIGKSYNDLNNNRIDILNLSSVDEFKSEINKIIENE